ILLGGTAGDYVQSLARERDLAVDANGNPLAGASFAHLEDPVINSQGYAAFTATLTGSGVTRGNNEGLWWGKPGSLRLVARKGDAAPGTNGRFGKFCSIVLPDDNSVDGTIGPVFLAKLSDKPNSLGLWAVDSQGTVQLVASKGDSMTINGKR